METKKILSIVAALAVGIGVQAQSWPEPTLESRPGSRWWWLGSAVDASGLKANMREYAKTGIGALEITPIYGVKGNSANELSFLSSRWMQALKMAEQEGQRDSILIDMSTGTGWPFGGPNVPVDEAACKVLIVKRSATPKECRQLDISVTDAKEKPFARLNRVMAYSDGKAEDVTRHAADGVLRWKCKGKKPLAIYAVYYSRTRQQVKRAAPGGAGYVIDHFDRNAVKHYLERFDSAFAASKTPYPNSFFNDSYEVYGANWTPTLFEEFEKRRGYRLEERLPQLLGDVDESGNQTLADYRETLSDLLLENFTQQWASWAHSHGATVRNQAHGSPANLIDIYSAVDIPEIEGFGLTNFHLKGLRTDEPYTRKNDSDVSMLKYASSAAHITGKRLTSSETFTWLTEHFRTSLSQCKPDLDLMFTCGVNRMFFHGTCYSPPQEQWPGWHFYASIDMSPTNSIWRDAPFLMQYITRCQSFLQWGEPDNDFLVLLPVRDMWARRSEKGEKGLLMQFDIHSMAKKAPEFIKSILEIDSLGFDCDYISERHLMATKFENGMIQTAAGTRYKALIIPGSGKMSTATRQHIDQLKSKGARIVFGNDAAAMLASAKPEEMKSRLGLRSIRRKNAKGHHYFIVNLTPEDICETVELAVPCKSAVWFNPLNGERYAATVENGKISIDLRSGESMILQTFDNPTETSLKPRATQRLNPRKLDGKWTLAFSDCQPKVARTFQLNAPQTWEQLDDDSAKVTIGTGIYTTHLKMSKADARKSWSIDLGDVRESARLYINGRFIGCAWSVPFTLDCKDALHAGDNEIRIEVTNLPANRIADLDRKGVEWRKFNEINVVDIHYKKTHYDSWAPVPSGLASDVYLYESR